MTAYDYTYGTELWKSDGTSAGTQMVKDIDTNSNLSSNPRDLIDVNNTLFFYADVDVHGYELWKSDGTTSGTIMVKDIRPNQSSSSSRGRIRGNSPTIANVNGEL